MGILYDTKDNFAKQNFLYFSLSSGKTVKVRLFWKGNYKKPYYSSKSRQIFLADKNKKKI